MVSNCESVAYDNYGAETYGLYFTCRFAFDIYLLEVWILKNGLRFELLQLRLVLLLILLVTCKCRQHNMHSTLDLNSVSPLLTLPLASRFYLVILFFDFL